jgi:hypothetical protein
MIAYQGLSLDTVDPNWAAPEALRVAGSEIIGAVLAPIFGVML